VSTMVVETLSGVPSDGGSVTCGSTGWIFAVTKTSLTSDVMMELLPTPSSPHTQMRTEGVSWCRAKGRASGWCYRSPYWRSMVIAC
jgi:hypothetical protein